MREHNLWLNLASARKPRPIPLGWDWLAARLSLCFTRHPKAAGLLATARAIEALEQKTAAWSEEELSAELVRSKILFRLHRETADDQILALAAVREAAFRTLGKRPFATQLAGALGLLQGCIVEMATGEGKTLTAAMAAVLQGWRGKGCHVVTANEYLAGRDAEEMGPLYQRCAVSVAAIGQQDPGDQRLAAYACDVTYLTSRDVAADYLRDRMQLGQHTTLVRALAASLGDGPMPAPLQRGLACAIVDEADSVLCDGGSTPLIISAESGGQAAVDSILLASRLADSMQAGVDFQLNRAFREARLTEQGNSKIAEVVRQGSVFSGVHRARELVLQAIEARQFFQRSVHYVLHDDKVVIVDEGTGRLMPDHEWRDGMHQAVAAKEGLPVQPPKATFARTTFQEFFLRYPSLAGMTGTAWEARREFLQFYRLFVVRLPTFRTCLRQDCGRAAFARESDKIAAVAERVTALHALGRPVLVGTKSIGDSEKISSALHELGIAHEVLNAEHHQREADIIALAGQKNAVTVATNMAGRGTDIKLSDEARAAGGLHVILTQRHASRRIDRQLYGRCARQGDPGSTEDIISLEDELFATLPGWLKKLLARLCRANSASPLVWLCCALCQSLSDARGFRQRKRMVKSSMAFEDLTSYTGTRH